MTIKNAKRAEFFNLVDIVYGKDLTNISRNMIQNLVTEKNIKWPHWLTNDRDFKLDRGYYNLEKAKQIFSSTESVSLTEKKKSHRAVKEKLVVFEPKIEENAVDNDTSVSFIPTKHSGYVKFGHFNDVQKIIASGIFYPTYITGLSGNGKTIMVEQVCADLNRECIRVNITIETDEDDLIGGFRLIDGQTVWQDGPVIAAMQRGAILLLDEIDLGSNRLMCLQPVLEGKGIYIKKINKKVTPIKGFNIFATANTKGRGSDDGKFIGTNVMNEAFLERFSITMEQEYPSLEIERKILKNVLAKNEMNDDVFVENLVKWGDLIRKSYMNGAINDILSTRRLIHIVEAYSIFKNKMKAIQLCLNRFDVDTKTSFLDFYKKIDAEANENTQNNKNEKEEEIVSF